MSYLKNSILLIVLLLATSLVSCGDSGSSPDLTIYSFSATPIRISSGGNISLSAAVSNSGNGSAYPTSLRYYRSTDNAISTSDTEITSARDSVSILLAGSSGIESTSVTGHSSGVMYYGACVDGVYGEYSTTNNCSIGIAVTVSSGGRGSRGGSSPDLTIYSFSVTPSSISSRGNIRLSTIVSNIGNGSAGSTTLRYYRSINNVISIFDTEITSARDIVSSLSGGGISTESTSVAGHSSGVMYYGVCVDSVSGEYSTTNNCSIGMAVTVSSGG